MKFAVQLKGAAHTLESVAKCFQGDFARIRKLGDDWFLESSAFDACTTGAEVFPIADGVLRLIHRVSALYMQMFSPFETGYVETFSETGIRINRTLRGSQKINIYSSKGLQELQSTRGAQSLGSAVVGLAITDKKVEEALALVGENDLQWSQLYNILEFLGGEDAIVKKKWAARKQVRNCRQTANHHRHLGSNKKHPRPPVPPALGEATSFVLDILKKWMSTQL